MAPPSAHDPKSSTPRGSATPKEIRALGYLAFAALAALVWVALPVAVGLFLGALLAFTLQPIYGRLRARRWHAGPAALACALGSTALMTAAVTGLMTLFVTRGVALVASLPGLLAPGGGLRVAAERHLQRFTAIHLSPEDLTAKLQEQAVGLGSRAAEVSRR